MGKRVEERGKREKRESIKGNGNGMIGIGIGIEEGKVNKGTMSCWLGLSVKWQKKSSRDSRPAKFTEY
jgi:hypothetical protein